MAPVKRTLTQSSIVPMARSSLLGLSRFSNLATSPSKIAVGAQVPINAVVSMGRRNTFLKFTRRSLKT
jgi:hypothetical protein